MNVYTDIDNHACSGTTCSGLVKYYLVQVVMAAR